MTIFLEIFHNIALVLVMSVVYSFLYRNFAVRSMKYQVLSGILYGLIAVIGMTLPFHLMPGIIFDGRSIVLSIAGFFGGPVSAAVSAVIAGLFRIRIGGGGSIMGVSVIASSALIGTAFFYLRKSFPAVTRIPYLLLFGILVHVAMLALTAALPGPVRFSTFQSIAIPVITIYPVATVIVCRLFLDQESQIITLRNLHASEDRYRGIVENMPLLICRFLPSTGIITFANEQYRSGFPSPRGERTAFHLFDPGEENEAAREQLSQISPASPVNTREIPADTPSGKRIIRWINQGIFNEKEKLNEIQSIGIDITERKEAEDLIKNSLREKEILLKEIHHRVKNNMQIISSLLNLQTMQISDEKQREMFIESRNRVRSMALIHEKLYSSDNLAEISFDDYIRMLALEIQNTFLHRASNTELRFDLQPITLGIDLAIPCALLFNEILSNAFKYAFPDKREGTIAIEFKRSDSGSYSLSVFDNGVGLPPGIEEESGDTLGFQLIHALTRQIDGAIRFDRCGGTAITVTFNAPPSPGRSPAHS